MKFKRNLSIKANIPTTTMADIVFLLLIFFIISTTFVVQPAIKIKLPQATTKEMEPTEAVMIFLTKDSRLFINEEEIAWSRDLASILKPKIYASRENLVVIKADREVDFGRVVKIMDIAKQAGAKRLAVATQPIEEE